jgi:hypothetical protein
MKVLKALWVVCLAFVMTSALSGCSVFLCWLCEISRPPAPVKVSVGPPIVFSGKIVSNLGGPVAGAVVEISGKTTKTDGNGSFMLPVSLESRYVLSVSKDGFAPLSRIAETGILDRTYTLTQATVEKVDPTQDVVIKDKLSLKGCQGPLSSRARIDWETVLVGNKRPSGRDLEDLQKLFNQPKQCSPGVTIALSANSLVDENGNPPSGPVNLSLATADLFAPDGMPGDFTVFLPSFDESRSLDRDSSTVIRNVPWAGQYAFMESFGAGSITVTAGGKSYQPKSGSPATMTIPIDPTRLNFMRAQGKEPDFTIPIMYYAETLGIWYIDGSAELNATKDAYIARLAHFSWVNVDQEKIRPRCIKFSSSSLPTNFDLVISFPGSGTPDITRSVSNPASDTLHAVTRLPENTNVRLTAYQSGTTNVITMTQSINTGVWPGGATPVPFPSLPYTDCVDAGNLHKDLSSVNKPTLTVTHVALGFLRASWNGKWDSDIAPHPNDGYVFEESTDGGITWHVVKDDIANNDIFATSAGPGGVQNDRSPKNAPSLDLPDFAKKRGSYQYRVKAFYGALPGADPANASFYKISDTFLVSVLDSRLRIINNIDTMIGSFQDINVLRLRIAPVQDPRDPVGSPPAVALKNGDQAERMPVDSTCSTTAAAAIGAPIGMHEIAPAGSNPFPNLVTTPGAPHYDIWIELGWWKINAGTSNQKIHPSSGVTCSLSGNASKQLHNPGTVPTHYHRHFGGVSGYIRVQNHYTGDLTLTITGDRNNPVISSATYLDPTNPLQTFTKLTPPPNIGVLQNPSGNPSDPITVPY